MDADDAWLPTRLGKTVGPMMENPAIGLSYCLSYREFDDGFRIIEQEDKIPHRQKHGIYPPPYLCAPASTIRRTCFDRCGTFDTTLRHFQDIDLFIRIAEEFESYRVDEPLVIIYDHDSSHSKSTDPDISSEMLIRYTCKAIGRGRVNRDWRAALAEGLVGVGIKYFDTAHPAGASFPSRRRYLN